MEANEKKCFVHIDNYTGEKPIEIIYREDNPAKHLDPIEPTMPDAVNIEGIISTPLEWLKQRAHLYDMKQCHVIVEREKAKIRLVVNESGYKPGYSESILPAIKVEHIMPSSTITGSVEYSDVFNKLHINDDYFVDPIKLAKFFRMNRVLFSDPKEGMGLVTALKKVQATISGNYEKAQELHTKISKTEYMSQEVTHNLPEHFTLTFNIFKGSPKERFDVEIDADVIDGRIAVQLVSPAVNDANEEARDKLLNEQIEEIKKLCPDLLIVEK